MKGANHFTCAGGGGGGLGDFIKKIPETAQKNDK